jgi:replicative DNA helicase
MSELASTHAEKTILGAILLENSAFYEAAQDLRADEFYLDSHRRIYACISRLMNRGSAADITTVPEEFRATGELEAVGGFGYILDLEADVPRNLSIPSYVRLVKEKASLREMRALGEALMNTAEESGRTIDELLDRTEGRLLKSVPATTGHSAKPRRTRWAHSSSACGRKRIAPVSFLAFQAGYQGST